MVIEKICSQILMYVRQYVTDVSFYFIYTPGLTLLYVICIIGSMIMPGVSGSAMLSAYASDLNDQIQAERYHVETLKQKQKRFISEYQQIAGRYSKEDQTKVDGLIQEMTNRMDPIYVTRLENIIRLPYKTKMLLPLKEGKAFKDMLESSGYNPAICLKMYNYIAITATALKYQATIARNTPFLIGPPGVGKTRLVQKMAETLGLPFLSITLDPNQSVGEHLFGTPSNFKPAKNGQLVDFITHQKDANGKPVEENIYPIVLFFDEIDKVLNNTTGVYTAKPFFLHLLNNGSKFDVECMGLNGINISFDKMIIILGANEEITTLSDTSTSSRSTDTAFMDRIDLLRFEPYTNSQKHEIANNMIKDILHMFGRPNISANEKLKELIDADNWPGVRVLKTNLTSMIVEEIAKEDGWDIHSKNIR